MGILCYNMLNCYFILQISLDQRIIIRLDSYKNEVFEATVTKIYPYMNERSKTFLVEAKFTKNKHEYLPIPNQQINLSGGIYIQNPGY